MKYPITGLLAMMLSFVPGISSANPSPLPVPKEQARSHLVEANQG